MKFDQLQQWQSYKHLAWLPDDFCVMKKSLHRKPTITKKLQEYQMMMLLYIRHPSGPCGDIGHLGHYKK